MHKYTLIQLAFFVMAICLLVTECSYLSFIILILTVFNRQFILPRFFSEAELIAVSIFFLKLWPSLLWLIFMIVCNILKLISTSSFLVYPNFNSFSRLTVMEMWRQKMKTKIKIPTFKKTFWILRLSIYQLNRGPPDAFAVVMVVNLRHS